MWNNILNIESRFGRRFLYKNYIVLLHIGAQKPPTQQRLTRVSDPIILFIRYLFVP